MKDEVNKDKNNSVTDKGKSNSETKNNTAPSYGNRTLTLIVLGFVLLVVLTIAVVISLKLQEFSGNKTLQKESFLQTGKPSQTEKSDITKKTQPASKEDLILQVFRYPGSVEAAFPEDEIYCVQLLMYTNDPVTTVYQYYEELIDLNNWETGPAGMQTGYEAAFIYIREVDFGADMFFKKEAAKEGSTKIEINVTCLNGETISSTYSLPSSHTTLSQPTPPPDFSASQSGQNGFILPFSDSRTVTKNDLVGLTPWELKVARNEIYARHGRQFLH